MSVTPLDLHSCAGALVDFDRLWFYRRHADKYKCVCECPSVDRSTYARRQSEDQNEAACILARSTRNSAFRIPTESFAHKE